MEVKSIADIAALAGVAKTTVSAVLNGKSKQYRIAEKTQERILTLVKEHNFRPNRVARSLRTQKTNTIGLIVPDLTNCFFSQLTKALESIARSAGYQVLIASSEDTKKLEIQAIENFLDFSVDGMIVASMLEDEDLNKVLSTNTPVVFIDREMPGSSNYSVTSEHYKGARSVISHLFSLSDEVAYIGRSLEISSAVDRYKAYTDSLAETNIKLDKNLVELTEDTAEQGKACLAKIEQKLGRLPKAFFTSSYLLLLGCIEYIRERYADVPKDIHIATFDNTVELDLLSFKVHSVQQDCQKLAEASFAALISHFEGKSKPSTVTIETKVIKR
ncbi:MAG: LacI family DNA-binding transcriptional regulator [Lentisphaeraceae bacterium]|nr:LacI family DNA-binding transcriptional regulator [Lentisphaeraceae bacterium]